MKFKITNLKEELGFVVRALESRTTIPVLSNVLIESVDGRLLLTATDLDVTLRTFVEADIEQEGRVCLQGKKLLEIVKTLDGELSFTKDDNEWVRLTAGRSKFRLAGVSSEQYPVIPEFSSAPIEVENLNKFVSLTSFAITQEQSRFTLSGAKFEIKDGIVRMVTTDGHRLALVESPQEGTLDTLIPKKTLQMANMLEGKVLVTEDANHISFQTGDRTIISRKLNGNFPNYQMVLPKDHDKHVTFDTESLARAVKRTSLMADERNKSIKLVFSEGQVEIKAQSAEEGEGSEVVETDYQGDEVTFGFNWTYLLDFLTTTKSPTFTFGFKDNSGQTELTDGELRYVVMPLRTA